MLGGDPYTVGMDPSNLAFAAGLEYLGSLSLAWDQTDQRLEVLMDQEQELVAYDMLAQDISVPYLLLVELAFLKLA